MKTKNMTTLHLRNSINRSPLRRALPLIAVALACFGLAPQAPAVCQQGCGSNSNTFLGDSALINNTTGFTNTASGYHALEFNTDGYDNPAYNRYANVDGYGDADW